MSEDPDKLALDVVGELLELPADERAARVAVLCDSDPPLHSRVVSLLRELSDVAESTVAGDFFTPGQAAAPAAPTTVGKYRIIKLIGAGGMGEVFEAEQERPRRRVALKLLRAVRFTSSMLRRFEYEAEWLARLDHPGIARVYEAGTAATPRGLVPFFAMELIEGQRLNEWLAAQKPDLEARVKLLIALCDAIQHAHQKGLIHRDLKPANILVTAEGQPKVLDFGVARATTEDGSPGGGHSVHTREGAIVGTMQYMSPEQAAGDLAQLDTRSDVYALGVIAYQVLGGKVPYDVATLSIPKAIQAIQDSDPPRLGSVDKQLRGDLETIVGKAMEKDRARRYASAAGMGADLQRYLEHRPIAARPPTLMYQFRKFARRHVAVVVAGALLLVTLLAGIGGTTWGMVRAIRAREAEAKQRVEAENARAVAEHINEFLNEMLSEVDPATAKGGEPTVREVLDRAARNIDGRFADQPLVAAELRTTFGTTYHYLGLYDKSAQQLKAAMDLRLKSLGPDDPLTLQAVTNYAGALSEIGKTAEAAELLSDALPRIRRVRGEDHEETLQAINDTACSLIHLGRPREALPLFEDLLPRCVRVLGEDDLLTVMTGSNLAATLNGLGRHAEAESLLRARLEHERSRGRADHPETLRIQSNLSSTLLRLGRLTEAEQMLRDLLERRTRVLGGDHPQTLNSKNGLALTLTQMGQYDQAEPIFREVLQAQRAALGPDHPDTLSTAGNYGGLLLSLGRAEESEALYRESLERARRTLGADHPDTLHLTTGLGSVLMTRREYDQALAVYREAYAAICARIGTDSPQAAHARAAIGMCLQELGKHEEAVVILQEFDAASDKNPLGPQMSALVAASHGLCLRDLGRRDEAERALKSAVPLLQQTGAVGRKRLPDVLAALASLAEQAGRADDAATWRRELEKASTTRPN